jgi:hypothetical protein
MIVLWLVLFFPYGLYLMWRRTSWRPGAKVTITAGFLVLAVVVAAASSGAPTRAPAGASEPEMSLQELVTGSPVPTEESPSQVPASTRATLAASTSKACRADPLANVYHPSRLEVIEPCVTVSGTVMKIRHEDDGDFHINLKLDLAYASLINEGNIRYQDGYLVVEIVPADEPGCIVGEPPRRVSGTYDYGLCTGAGILSPGLGTHIAVTGPYVIDHHHDWAEIHPVWTIETLGSPGSTLPPAKPAAVRITSIAPNPVNPGQYMTLKSQTGSNAACAITVTYASGRVSSAAGLEPKRATGAGAVSWTWKVGTRTGAGTATANVACGSKAATATFEVM